MEGDKVIVSTSVCDENGISTVDTEISEKPQFMLDEEYNESIIDCAVGTLKVVCAYMYPNSKEMQARMAEAIAKKAMM